MFRERCCETLEIEPYHRNLTLRLTSRRRSPKVECFGDLAWILSVRLADLCGDVMAVIWVFGFQPKHEISRFNARQTNRHACFVCDIYLLHQDVVIGQHQMLIRAPSGRSDNSLVIDPQGCALLLGPSQDPKTWDHGAWLALQ